MKLERYEDSPERRSELFRFYEEVYPDSPWLHDPDRFVWQNLHNPLHEPNQTEIWLLHDDDGKIVGQNIYILTELTIDRRLYRGICSTNLIVRPQMVGKGTGHRFVTLNESRGGIAYAVGITPASTRAFQKFGWILHETARLHTMILHPLPNLNYLKFPLWKKISAYVPLVVASWISSARFKLRSRSWVQGLTVQPITSFDSADDPIWERCLGDVAIYHRRTARMLNYKYSSRSDVDHKKFTFNIGGNPVGYVVVRLSVNPVRKIRLGRIVDVVYNRSMGKELLEAIFIFATKFLRQEQIDAVVAVGADDEIGSVLKSLGFGFSRVQPAIIKPTDFNLDQLKEKYKVLWYITLGDSDLDNYW